MDPVALKPAEGRRLILPEGGTTLDGIGLAPGADVPDEGAFVTPGVWSRKRLDEGDALPVEKAALAAGQKRADAREKPAPADKKADTSNGSPA